MYATISEVDVKIDCLSIYEGRLFVLFCSFEIHQTGMLHFLVSLERS
jgi:hypothetical protein